MRLELVTGEMAAALARGAEGAQFWRKATAADIRRVFADKRDLDRYSERGGTMLACAIEQGNAEAVGVLLNLGANTNARDGQGAAALHRAAVNGDPGIVRMLLDAGANAEATERRGVTPLVWAVAKG